MSWLTFGPATGNAIGDGVYISTSTVSLVLFFIKISLTSKDASYGAGGHLYGKPVMQIAILPCLNARISFRNFGICSASYRLNPPFSANPSIYSGVYSAPNAIIR